MVRPNLHDQQLICRNFQCRWRQ